MYPFPQSVTPAIRTHLDAQVAFLNDLSKSFAQSLQKFSELNIQLSQTLLEEGNIASQKLLTTDRPTEVINIAASRAQPAAEKLRSYHQHVSRTLADTQVELARVTEQHVQETSRTARALADEVARAATQETEQNMRNQQEILRNFRDPFQAGQQAQHAAAQRQGEQHAYQHASSGNLQKDTQQATQEVASHAAKP